MSDLALAPDGVFRVWRERLKIELEAAALFRSVADACSKIYGPQDKVAQLALAAEAEELHHAELCNQILKVKGFDVKIEPIEMDLLGPEGASLGQKLLYTAVALGVVTETYSTALLIRMRELAEDRQIHQTVDTILKDEITHARIGWAELARQKQIFGHKALWLKDHILSMIRVSIDEEVVPMVGYGENLSPWGVLTQSESKKLVQDTTENVLRPGLSQYGLWPEEAETKSV